MEFEGEFHIPSAEAVVEWLRATANSIEAGHVGNINRAMFIGLDRGNGTGYKPLVSMIYLDVDEAVALVEVSKSMLIQKMFEPPPESAIEEDTA